MLTTEVGGESLRCPVAMAHSVRNTAADVTVQHKHKSAWLEQLSHPDFSAVVGHDPST